MASTLPPTLTLVSPPPPGLQEATKNSTTAWQADLEALFHHAKDRFPDVVWELVVEEEEEDGTVNHNHHYNQNRNQDVEEVWGHKAIVYARAPPSFQNRYFSFRSNNNNNNDDDDLPPPEDSSLSLRLLEDDSSAHHHLGLTLEPRTPSPSHTATNSHSHSHSHAQSIRPASPGGGGPSTNLLRLTTSINPSLFSDELEYLYTGKGFGEAFEFLFDSSDTRERTLGDSPNAGISGSTALVPHSGGPNGSAAAAAGGGGNDAESLRIDKLRKDLVFMWRSRLYSDVRIALTGNFGGGQHHESTTAIFSSHRFILVSRSPYFYNALIAWPGPGKNIANNNNNNNNNEPPTLTLPSPPFTPASLHFTLGFIYTGTLIFSHRSYDLQTSFSLLKSALYLSLPSLHDEVQARIVQEMMHGLFHAFLPFAAYEELTRGRWGTGAGGCRCRQCARRMPRVLAFSLEEDVRNACLERGARRGLVGLFGEGWCTPEFAGLPLKIRESVLRGVRKRTTPENAFGLLWAAESALDRLGRVVDPWGEVVKEAVGEGRKGVDELMGRESEKCFESEDWMDVMRRASEAEGMVGAFEDSDRVSWVMSSVLRGVKERYAAVVYQTLVSSILLRPHPSDTSAPFLPVTSHVHVQVERARVELLKWIAKRWLNIRQERGFDELEGWALKEISDHIEVPIDDLLSPPSYSSQKALSSSHTLSNPSFKRSSANLLLRPVSQHPHTSKVDTESEAASSIRVSVLSRSIAGGGGGGASVRSQQRSTRSRTMSEMSGASQSTVSVLPRENENGQEEGGAGAGDSPAKRIVKAVRERERDRPDSKLTPGLQVDDVDGGDDDDMYVDDDVKEEEEEQREQADEADVDGDGPEETASDVPSVYHTPRPRTRPTTATDISTPTSPRTAVPAIQKTLITRASLASVKSTRSGVAGTPRTRTGSNVAGSPTTPTDSKSPKPRSLAPSIKSQAASTTPRTTTGSARKSVLSAASTASASTSHYSSALEAGASRPSSRGSAYSTTTGARAGRLAATTKTRGTGTATPSPASRPVSRVSTVSTTRSISGGNRPTSTATETSTSTYKTAPGPAGSSATLNTPPVPSQRARKTSAASVRTAGGGRSAAGSPVSRTRKVSTASVSSVASSVSTRANAGSGARTMPAKRPAGQGVVDPNKLSPVTTTTTPRAGRVQASTSAGSVKSSVSTSSVSAKKSPTTTTTTSTTTPGGIRTRTLSNKKSVESMKGKKKPVEDESVVVVVVPVPPLPQRQEKDKEEGEVEMGSPPPPALPSKDESKMEEEENVSTSPLSSAMDETSTTSASEHIGDTTVLPSSSSSSEEVDEFSAANTTTTSTMTVRQKVYENQHEHEHEHEHKKTSSSASSSSVATLTLRRKGSSDTIRTVKSSGQSLPGSSGGSAASKSRPSSHPEEIQPNVVPTSPPLPPLPILNSPVLSKKSQSGLSAVSQSPLSQSPLSQSPLSLSQSQSPLPLSHQQNQNQPSSTSLSQSQSSLPQSQPQPQSQSQPQPHSQPHSIDSLLASDTPTGATLEIGIPCIISSKRKRFKAYARYIGEVAGEYGSWVGVEVPMPVGGSGDGSDERAGGMGGWNAGGGNANGEGDDRQWNDGSWCGIRYFEIGGSFGGAGSEWGDYSGGAGLDDRAARRRRVDASSMGGYGYGGYNYGGYNTKNLLKREGDQLSISSDRMKRMRSVSPAVSDMSGTESRGLFVRPQQVLYVVDAVGADF